MESQNLHMLQQSKTRVKWSVWNPPGSDIAFHDFDNEEDALRHAKSIKDKHPKNGPPICEKTTIEVVEV